MSDYYTREQLFETDGAGNYLLHRSIINADAALSEAMTDMTEKSVYESKLKDFYQVYASILKELTADEQKTYLNLQNSHGESALFLACDKVVPEIVKFLLNNYWVKPNLADNNNITPLMAACVAESHVLTDSAKREVISSLLKRGDLNVNLTNANGETALSLGFYDESNKELQSLLLEHKSTSLILDGENGARSLFLACEINYYDGVQAIVNYYNDDTSTLVDICNKKYDYISPNLETDLELTPFQIACINYNFDIIGLLLSIDGIDVNGIGFDRNTTLHFACFSAFLVEDNTVQKDIRLLQNTLCVIELLLRHPDIEKQQANFEDLLPFNILINVYTVQEILWQICELGCSNVFTWLKASVTESELIAACNQRQRLAGLNVALTPLQLACVKGNVSMVSRLLAIPNIDVDAPLPRNGLSTLSLMFSRLLIQVEHNKVVNIVNLLLMASQTDVNRMDASRCTALMHAISSNSMLPNTMSHTVIEQLAYLSLPSINHSSLFIVDDRPVSQTALDLCINRAFYFKNIGDELRYNYYLQIMNTLFSFNAKREQTEPEIPADLKNIRSRIGCSSLSRFDELSYFLYPSSSGTRDLLFFQSATSLTSEEKCNVLSLASQDKDFLTSSSCSSTSGLSQKNESDPSAPSTSVFSGSVMYRTKRNNPEGSHELAPKRACHR